MTLRSEFNRIIKKLSEIPIGVPGYYDLPPFRDAITLFSRSLEETVNFLDRACYMDQLGWMSKVFYRISANLKSWEFVDALNRAAMRYTRQTDRDLFIRYCIPEAEKGLPFEVYCQRYPDKTEDDRQEIKSMSRTGFKRELAQIIKLHKIDSEEDYTELPYYWDASPVILAEIAVLSRNLEDTIRFLDLDCTGEQLDYMCAVFGEVSFRLKSWEFVDALERAADRLSKNYSVDRIRDFIKDAIGVLPDEVYGQRFPDEPEDDNSANDLAEEKNKGIMTIKCEFNKIIKKLSEIPIGVPDYYDLPPFRNAIALFSHSLPETVEFLDCVCDADQLGWMSKIFYHISANLKSWDFVDALKRAAMHYIPRMEWDLFIKYCIPEAEKGLPYEVYCQRYPDEDDRQTNKSMSRTRFKRELTKIIELQKIDSDEYYDDLPYYSETSPVIRAEIALLSRNLQDTIRFLDFDCTEEQLDWMCAVVGEVSFRLKSSEFIDALIRAADRFPKDCSEHNIRDCIEYAINVLPDEVYGQRFPDEPEEETP